MKQKQRSRLNLLSKMGISILGMLILVPVLIFGLPFSDSSAQVTSADPSSPYMIGPKCDMIGTSPHKQIEGVGTEGQGAGMALADINRNGTADLIMMAYDNPAKGNSFRYRIGWDLDPKTWSASSWTNNYIEVPGVGWEAQGAGVAIADIDRNGTQDMVLMAYDNPPGPNQFRYKIGFNLDKSGRAERWGEPTHTTGTGDEAAGAGVAVADINNNGKLDLLMMNVHSTQFIYKIGWDIDKNGKTANWSQNFPLDVKNMGSLAQGAGVAIADIDLDNHLDLVLMRYDNPDWNNFRYCIGWRLQPDGNVKHWSRWYMLKGVGQEAQGADIIYYYSTDAGPCLGFMAYDNPAGPNNFLYFFRPVTTAGACFGYADDPPSTADNKLCVPANLNDQSGTKLFNLNMSEVQNTANDALALYLFGAETSKPNVDEFLYNYPDKDSITYTNIVSNPKFSNRICPDFLVAAVAWYVDKYMGYVVDEVNAYVLNNIHNLNYGPGGEGIPAYYTIHYTNPTLYPNLIAQVANAPGKGWDNQANYTYNDDRLYHGDCEDFAILRHALLRALGFNRNYIWNGYAPGHEFNVVLYKGAYRIMDYGPIYQNFNQPSDIVSGLNEAWNQVYGPRDSKDKRDYFKDNLLFRIYPDRCGAESEWGWMFTRKAMPDFK